MLTQILQVRRLLDQPINLRWHIQLVTPTNTVPKVPTGQLLLDPRQHLQSARVLDLLCLGLVDGLRRDRRAVAGAAGNERGGCEGICRGGGEGGGGRHADDRGAALRGEVGFGRGVAGAEAPGKKGVVDELVQTLACRPHTTRTKKVKERRTASSTAMTDSLFVLRTRITCSHVVL
jgi:hypothetical protein